jgi:probable HAF family extracellular repeat protein
MRALRIRRRLQGQHPLVEAVVLCVGVVVAAALLLPAAGTAQADKAAANAFAIVDPGTFGGPQSFLDLPAVPLTKEGALLGQAETTIADADYPNFNPFMVGFPDPVLLHAFEWQKGQLTDLGALPGNNSSAVFEVNGNGVGVGMSETGTIDPYTGWPADNAVMFKDGRVIDLGTVPGGYESQAVAINDQGQVAGFAFNGIPDAYSGVGTEGRAFIWQNGVMQDIGTLGGPDTGMDAFNARGQIAGHSFTSSTPNAATGMPTQDAYVWTRGLMRDLGTLGGTIAFASWLNDAGDVSGTSSLAGDQTVHPFLWDGKRMIDLGTLGGPGGNANFLNAAGRVTGSADLPDGTHDAFLWANGQMHDLPLPPIHGALCSNGFGINNRDEVVGNATDCRGNALAAVLWRHGVAYDLNALVAPSPLHLVEAEYISDRGEIVGVGVLPNGDQHVFLLAPDGRSSTGSLQLAATRPSAQGSPVRGVGVGTRAARVPGCAVLPVIVAARLCAPQ